jgi:hypothetical protein
MVKGSIDLLTSSYSTDFLNTNPEITHFRKIFYRYTHFSKDYTMEYFNTDPAWNSEILCTLSKSGDLVSNIFLVTQFSLSSAYLLATIPDVTVPPLSSTMISLFQKYLPIAQPDAILQAILKQGFVDPRILTETIAGLSSLTGLVTKYGNKTLYLAYTGLDYWSMLVTLDKNYASRVFNRDLMMQVISHPYLQFGGPSAAMVKATPSVLLSYIYLFIDSVYLDVGGTVIVEHINHLLNISMSMDYDSDSPLFQNLVETVDLSTGTFRVYLPMIFFFCVHNGAAFPMVSLKYHDVTIGVKIGGGQTIQSYIQIQNVYLLTETVFLTSIERIKFTTGNLEYLIMQSQWISSAVPVIKDGSMKADFTIDINFTGPVVNLYWFLIVTNKMSPLSLDTSYLYNGIAPIKETYLLFNNERVGTQKDPNYFRFVQPYQHRYRTPDSMGVYTYSFALAPAEYHQPSGSCNMTYIDNKSIRVVLDDNLLKNPNLSGTLWVISNSYNVLQIANGFSRLVFK